MLKIPQSLLKTQRFSIPRLQRQATHTRFLYIYSKAEQPGVVIREKKPTQLNYRAAFCTTASEYNFLSFQPSWSQSDVRIIHTDLSENLVAVTWDDGNKNRYPLIYLRDICPCPSCVHPDFQQRISDVLVTCGLDYSSTAVNVLQDGNILEITWSDNHVSRFESHWLRDRQLRDEQDETNESNGLVKKGVITWSREMASKIPAVKHQQAMTDDWELLKMLDYLVCYGFVIVKNGPTKEGEFMNLVGRVGHTISSFCGNPWKLPSSLSNTKLYNTTKELPFHNDMHFVQSVPGIQFFHCLKQASTGGESRLLDGFQVAIELKRKDPEAFRILTDCYVVNYEDDCEVHGDLITRPKKPSIWLDYDGTLKAVLIHETSRDLWHGTTVQNTECFIRAYGKLTELTRDPRFPVEFKLHPGETVIFDNFRLMHTRRGYPQDEERFFEGN